MTVIDLADPGSAPRVAMITRFPPSESGSAMAALDLSRLLARHHGFIVEVVRLLLPGETGAAGHPVVMDVNARWHMCSLLAAQRAERCDVVLVQVDRHTPIQLVDELLSELRVPVVLAIDDVGPVATAETRSLASLAMRAGSVTVPSETSRGRLLTVAADSIAIDVIPHGSPWRAMDPADRARRQILTWGYLGPGMGAERVIRSLAQLGDLDPKPRYRLVGVTDPGWTRREGDAYRADLIAEAQRLGVQEQLDIVPMLQSRQSLEQEIARSDVIAVVYDSRDRASSRILGEAVSTGRPVVATAFPAASEMLASGAGMTVDHDDSEAMAAAFRTYLTDDDEYQIAWRIAAAMSQSLSMEETARRYALLLRHHLRNHQMAVQAP